MPMLVGYGLSGKLVGGEMVITIGPGVAAQAVMNAILDPCVGQDMFETGARNRAGGKGVALHDHRRFGQYRLHAQGLELAPVKRRPEIGEAAVRPTGKPGAEIVL